MQLSISSQSQTPGHIERFPWLAGLKKLAAVRTPVGFTIGEAALWFAFVVMWPILLGSIYFLGGIFESGRAMPVNQFIVTSLVVAFTKAIVIIPFWWLYFVRLREFSVGKRILLHPLTGCIYAVACVFIVYHIKVNFLVNIGPSNAIVIQKGKAAMPQDAYPMTAVLLDFYNLLTAYVMNFVVFHAYNFWLSSQRQKQREHEIRELAFQSEINALKTQIEPHFLFNTLNSISASVPPTLEKTRVLIAQLADTFRYALRVNESQFVPLGDEIQFMKTWLALEQHRFGKRLTIEYKIDPTTLDVAVPPMLLQPLVENALNHGIAEKVQGGTVTIECRRSSDKSIYIGISDTGVGYSKDLSELLTKGVGLSNTARRLKLLYGQQLNIQRKTEGLLFSFHIPTQANYEAKSLID